MLSENRRRNVVVSSTWVELVRVTSHAAASGLDGLAQRVDGVLNVSVPLSRGSEYPGSHIHLMTVLKLSHLVTLPAPQLSTA